MNYVSRKYIFMELIFCSLRRILSRSFFIGLSKWDAFFDSKKRFFKSFLARIAIIKRVLICICFRYYLYSITAGHLKGSRGEQRGGESKRLRCKKARGKEREMAP